MADNLSIISPTSIEEPDEDETPDAVSYEDRYVHPNPYVEKLVKRYWKYILNGTRV